MKTYTSKEIADETGKTVQAISRYAQNHPGIGKKYGRDWVFTEAEYRRLLAVKPGRPRKPRRAKPAPAPATTQEETTPC